MCASPYQSRLWSMASGGNGSGILGPKIYFSVTLLIVKGSHQLIKRSNSLVNL